MDNKTKPTPWRYWLKNHQISVFWYNFGIANGLSVPKEYITKKGDTYTVAPEFMEEKLDILIKYLKQYGKSWDNSDPSPTYKTKKAFLQDEKRHPKRIKILKMIDLLQEYRIDEE